MQQSDDAVAGHQTLRVLDGSYVLDRPADVTEVIPHADVLAVVFGPDRDVMLAGCRLHAVTSFRSSLVMWPRR
jgi:hypothetical protein